MSTFSTEKLKQLVAYAVKGAGFDANITESMQLGIKVADSIISLSTTTGETYLRVSDRCTADDMNITVDAEIFSKLISKITSDTVDIDLKGKVLEVVGNGKYKLELIPDEEGNTKVFPDKFKEQSELIGTIPANDVVTINSSIKASLSENIGSIYSQYYVGDIVASTDRIMLSVLNKKYFDTAYLFSVEFMDLMLLSCADVSIYKSEHTIVAISKPSENCEIAICAPVPDNTSDYDIESLTKFANLSAPAFCRVKKVDLINLLDRLSLFVNKFDEGAIKLHFTQDCIEVSSMASSGIERIEYTECKDIQDKEIKINIKRLNKQIKAYNSDLVDLSYGGDVCIKLVDGDISQIIALMK